MGELKRRAGLVLVAAGVVLLATATYGFGTIVADRTVDVGVSSDGGAYLGIEQTDGTDVNGSDTDPQEFLDLTNNFEVPLTTVSVEVTDVSDGPAAVGSEDLVASVQEPIGFGDTEPVGLSCAADSDVDSGDSGVDVTIGIEASGDGVSVETSETVRVTDVDCAPSGSGSSS